MYTSLNQIPNPTDEQRHEMLRISLENAGRPEDYEYILRLLSPAPDITSIVSPGELRGVKIGIIGGGLAGMAAAYELEMSLRENFEALGLSQGAISLISGADPASGALLSSSYDSVAHEEYSLDYLNTYRIEHGNVYLPLAFYQSFASSNVPGYGEIPQSLLGNVDFKMGHNVTGIYKSDYRNKVVVKYTNNMENGDSADIFDYVICTIPFSALRTIEIKPLFSNMKMQAIMELNYIDAMKTLFLCNRRFWERNTDYGNIFGGISFTDLPIQSIIYPGDHSNCAKDFNCNTEEPGILVASYNLTQNSVRLGGMEESARYEVIRQNVEEVHGLPRGFLNSFIDDQKMVHWNNEPRYRGALALYLPQQKRLFSYVMGIPEYHGHVYFAGEHVSNKQGWIQGALSSAKIAANQLAEHFHNPYSV